VRLHFHISRTTARADVMLEFTDKTFSSKYSGAASAGIIRGAYHFAHPNKGSGAAQAQFFLANGGGWSNDGMTLPGAIDLESACLPSLPRFRPHWLTAWVIDEANCPACYGLSPSAMVSWIKDFSNTYQASTGRAPVIYTTTSWWKSCTGNSAEFGNNPLWLAHYSSTIGALPAGWEQCVPAVAATAKVLTQPVCSETIWQYAKSGSNPGDQDRFHGSTAELRTWVASASPGTVTDLTSLLQAGEWLSSCTKRANEWGC
jgi:GH25 family lysozyme M1 (1,4-beta-N-acetylmuramidase)